MNVKPFTCDAIAALLIGERMHVPVCGFCPRFATHCWLNGSDSCCEEHIEKLRSFLGENIPREAITLMGNHELAARLNATIWTP
jgi:hypothetical protein